MGLLDDCLNPNECRKPSGSCPGCKYLLPAPTKRKFNLIEWLKQFEFRSTYYWYAMKVCQWISTLPILTHAQKEFWFEKSLEWLEIGAEQRDYEYSVGKHRR